MRGTRAAALVHRSAAALLERYGWPALARRLADVLDAAVAGAPAR